MTALRAKAPGFFVTIQDRGRRGWRRFGVPWSGAMDQEALAAANALVRNASDEAAVEFAWQGGTWVVDGGACRFAVTGGRFAVSVNGWNVPANQSHTVGEGAHITIGGAPDAVWGYLAVAGGFALKPHLGSPATYSRSGIGGLHGGPLAVGDSLPLRTDEVQPAPELRFMPRPRSDSPLRVVLGPQDDYFDSDSISAFLSAEYRVTRQIDRMGYRLEGPGIAHVKGFNIISDGLVPGCIQVPGNGQPIVLLMDCQTTGGYPKPGAVIASDLGRLAQCRPGTRVRFSSVDIRDAQRASKEFRVRLAAMEQQLTPVDTGRQAWGLSRAA
jgi:5-oxoprolinase (ATP-hydrolysing) subunit C